MPSLCLRYTNINFKAPPVLIDGIWKRHSRKTMVLRYALEIDAGFPLHSVEEYFKRLTVDSWISASKKRPNCLINMEYAMAEQVDVWVYPIRHHKARRLLLQMQQGWNRICADLEQETYKKLLLEFELPSALRGSTLQESIPAHNIELEIDEGIPLVDGSGFILPITGVKCREG